MQAIHYSLGLHNIVRQFKGLSRQEIASLFKDRSFYSSLSLSHEEAQAVMEVFSEQSPEKPDVNYWYWA